MTRAQQCWQAFAVAEKSHGFSDPERMSKSISEDRRAIVAAGPRLMRRVRRAFVETDAVFVQVISRRGSLVSVIERGAS